MGRQKKIKTPQWQRAVIKVGSALVAPGNEISARYTSGIARFISASRNTGRQIILVSSGAVAAGLTRINTKHSRHQLNIAEKQAIAAIGQPLLMDHWSQLFDFPCAQLLLTYQGINDRQRFVNAKNTILKLLELETLPIVNENDTVIIDELKVGDNDNLAAHVAVLADADLLIICSDINGLYQSDPRQDQSANFIPVVENIDCSVYNLAGKANDPNATGGMFTKIEAAEKATARGINTVILNGTRPECLTKLLEGEICGTIFKKHNSPIKAKKHWMLHALPSSGEICIDRGAAEAVAFKGASLLPSGISEIKGQFTRGDAVDIIFRMPTQHSLRIAKGISQYDASDLLKIIGKKSHAIETILGYSYTNVAVHRDDLVLFSSPKSLKDKI